ncbi:MAG: endonuclease/exonuclease/phosphatase, partial [Gemmatimonadetes bacterium]|nr:endonuclease/exonuclease/phosphatase [Gemmatimonadota bacterium]NIQ57050.1 endonuclease/exonuclease/phosphatase [Gemmatimonadota bacterium]NIR39154.1 endonuclease/exonuclease/phosphatase [Actinomycetota bacterium]NIU77224.1 endonuclease/exonuclease/phosphatase [Gammaproteobacteria bacterium]NIX46510.1 endonuclease/exonuclease/phosphatase [Gemmatimonadota bacterium]
RPSVSGTPGLARSAAPAADTAILRVAAYNIRHGRGMDGRVDLRRTAEAIGRLDADVIALQEVDRETERTGGVDQTAVLAGMLGYRGYHGAHRPYQGGEYGNAVLTRLPVLASRTH